MQALLLSHHDSNEQCISKIHDLPVWMTEVLYSISRPLRIGMTAVTYFTPLLAPFFIKIVLDVSKQSKHTFDLG